MRSLGALVTFLKVAGIVRGGLDAISRKEEFIYMTLAVLMPLSDLWKRANVAGSDRP